MNKVVCSTSRNLPENQDVTQSLLGRLPHVLVGVLGDAGLGELIGGGRNNVSQINFRLIPAGQSYCVLQSEIGGA